MSRVTGGNYAGARRSYSTRARARQPRSVPPARILARAMTEDELLTAVTEAAELYGWRWVHIRRSDRAITMGHPGFPDLILIRGPALFAVELKSEAGKLTADQAEWLTAFGHTGAWYGVVRPRDLDLFLRCLATR